MRWLDNPIRPYAWGSHTTIANLQGRPAPTGDPEAELWMGAHPDSPSSVSGEDGPVRLDTLLATSPALLGEASLAQFGPRLPFMLKVLAAAGPLSLQVHPDPELAARRYAEEANRPAGDRLYADPFAKPELLVAIGEFDALCGFRDPSISADVLSSLTVPALDPVINLLRTGSVADRLRAGVEALLRWPEQHRGAIVDAVAAAAGRRGLDYVVRLGEQFRGDMGVVVALLCNRVRLDEGEAIWMPAGNLHSYLRGTGMEVLAASDNVLRGGFTAKRVDVAELLRVLRYEVLSDPIVKPTVLAPGIVTWPVPAVEFSLVRVTVQPGATIDLEVAGPCIAFCQRGSATIDDGDPLPLDSGQSAFGAAGRPLKITGDGVVFVASTGG